MPLMQSVSMRVPMRGGGAICAGARSITSWTESASAPSTVRSPSISTSMMITQVSMVFSMGDSPSLTRRSTTGTTCPRRLMTPRMKSGVRGTLVTLVNARTSRMRWMSIANSSRYSMKVKYCEAATSAAESASASSPCLLFLASTLMSKSAFPRFSSPLAARSPSAAAPARR